MESENSSLQHLLLPTRYIDISDIFEHSIEASVSVSAIPETAPDLAKVKASRKDQSAFFFGPNVISMCQMADIVFMALHGENGENGKIQAAFDLFGIKYLILVFGGNFCAQHFRWLIKCGFLIKNPMTQ